MIRDQYSEEDLQIIGCPSQEQVGLVVLHRPSLSLTLADKPTDFNVVIVGGGGGGGGDSDGIQMSSAPAFVSNLTPSFQCVA